MVELTLVTTVVAVTVIPCVCPPAFPTTAVRVVADLLPAAVPVVLVIPVTTEAVPSDATFVTALTVDAAPNPVRTFISVPAEGKLPADQLLALPTEVVDSDKTPLETLNAVATVFELTVNEGKVPALPKGLTFVEVGLA